ncbi:MAG: hypothetical protein KC635_05350, partial [Myxococcales bacterium]|nr:hypothetical protein [Myxococcales bacterium]
DAGGHGIYAYVKNTGLTFRDLDLSGHGGGYGLQIGLQTSNVNNHGGADHVVENVDVSHRATGAHFIATSNLTVDGLTATHDDARGVFVEGVAGMVPPTLSGLVLDDDGVGLRLQGFGGDPAAPFVVGPAAVTSVAGCDTSVELVAMTDTRLVGLRLDGRDWGVNVANGAGVTLTGLDASGAGAGVG